ncbi:MAG TPA: type II toxin-antitoxin system VapC family toxin [Rhizomicrobium sp.]|jgi:PIN domain nuclease of toxin-antitoxin system|nr:type II toxin-antitoxin system VapC family toxin [Rhizomicrobium sp.]
MLDASALLAWLNGEPGGDKVPVNTGDARISAVNYSEVAAVMTRRGASAADIRATLSSILLDIAPFDTEAAEAAGFMIASTKSSGLSFGDRACLATALKQGIPAMTADRSWSGLKVAVRVQLIR